MATTMRQVLGTVYAYEHSETVVSDVTEVTSEAIFIPPNVAQVSIFLRRKVGSGRYKVQVTGSTRDEIFGGTEAEWFDWDIPGLTDGWTDEDDIQWWIPIPSGIRIVMELGSGTELYFSMRAN
jgi:hypothetical protein